MNKIEIEDKYIKEFIVDTLLSAKESLEHIEKAKFHHNTDYKRAPLVCKHGILTLLGQNKIGLRNDSAEMLKRMDDIESHINGNDGISLSVVGLTDLYADEFEYNPFASNLTDFIISSDIKAGRRTLHYGNEFIHYGNIVLEKILSLDVRLLEYIESNKQISREQLIEMYNSLLESAIIIKETQSNLLLREMSSNHPFSINIDKFSESDSLVLKK